MKNDLNIGINYGDCAISIYETDSVVLDKLALDDISFGRSCSEDIIAEDNADEHTAIKTADICIFFFSPRGFFREKRKDIFVRSSSKWEIKQFRFCFEL